MAGIFSSSPFQNSKPHPSIRNSRNRSLKFGGGSNSGEQLLSIRASSAESKDTAMFVESFVLVPSIRRSD